MKEKIVFHKWKNDDRIQSGVDESSRRLWSQQTRTTKKDSKQLKKKLQINDYNDGLKQQWYDQETLK